MAKAYGNLLDLDIKWLLREYDREKGVQMHFTGFDRPNIKVKNIGFLG